MKSVALFIIGVFVGFILLSNENIIDFSKGKKYFSKSQKETNRYGDYDPGKDRKFTQEERDYFNKIAKFWEFSGEKEISRWHSDIKIYVIGEKRDYLLDELDRVVKELNEIIDPISIYVVDREEEANVKIFFGSHEEYGKLNPRSKKHLEHCWGLFTINKGKIIKKGSVFIDIYRCKNINTQKQTVRQEITQCLGLTNDSYTYPESVFYQGPNSSIEYSPIDRKLIDMLYNHW